MELAETQYEYTCLLTAKHKKQRLTTCCKFYTFAHLKRRINNEKNKQKMQKFDYNPS